MSEMEEKLNSLLSNPQLMQQIMSMAQAMGAQEPVQEKKEVQQEQQPFLDPKLLQSIARIAGQSGVDNHQNALLSALGPYLSPQRVKKLERAMRAARMAGAASLFLNSGGLKMLAGR